MYRTVEERLEALENQIARQSFQIYLLQNLAANHDQYAIYQHIISSNMSEHAFSQLKKLTAHYESQLERQIDVSMTDFVHEFKKVLLEDGVFLTGLELAELIPKWLGGIDGQSGYSPALYQKFYL